MLKRNMLSKFSELYDTIYADGVTDHSKIMKQISCLFLINYIDQIESQCFLLNMETVFTKENEHLRWKNFTELNNYEMYSTVKDEVYPFMISYIKDYKKDETLYSLIKDQTLYIHSYNTLTKCIDIINSLYKIFKNKKELLGEGFLYLLEEKNIDNYYKTHNKARLMSSIINPTSKDVIKDPFITDGSLLSITGLYTLLEDGNTPFFQGSSFSSDSDIFFFSYMNLFMHGITSPLLTDDYKSQKESADIVFTTLPFNNALSKKDFEKLSLSSMQYSDVYKFDSYKDYDNTAEVYIKTILETLKDNGKCACILPLELLESDKENFINIRKQLVENNNVKKIIRMKNHDNEEKTAILIFEKGGETSKVYFYDMEDYIESYADESLDFIKAEINESFFEISKKSLSENNYNFAYDFIV